MDNKKRTDKEVRENCNKNKCWELFYPDSTSSLMTYDPIEHEKDKTKKLKDKEKKIMELHNLVVRGLVNGLTHTHMDERRVDIDWVRKRGNLFEAFGRCVMNIITEQNYESNEKDLKEIGDEGYKK